MRILISFFVSMCFASLSPAADKLAVSPAGAKVIGPYSPGIVAGDSLYVSGQGARRPDGTFPDTPTAQLRQSLANMKAIVEAAGLTMDHLVYTQVYVRDPAAFPEIQRAWDAEFPKDGPARSMLGVVSLPDDTPVEVNAVAIRDLAAKRLIRVNPSAATPVPDAVSAGERVYLSDCLGRNDAGQIPADPREQVRLALERMGAVLRAAGIDHRHMVFVNPFMTDAIGYEDMNAVYAKYFEFGNTPARATIPVASLPNNASIEFTGVAVRDLSRRTAVRPKNMPPSPTASPCVFAGNVFYCSAKSGFIPGPHSGIYAETVESQERQTMRNLLDGLEEAGLSLSDVVAANVYLDDIADFAKMNRIYKLFMGEPPPARTTVQQHAPVPRRANDHEQWPTLEQISIIAVKPQSRAFELKPQSPQLRDLIEPGQRLELVAKGFGFTEGPVWDPRGFLYVSDEELNKIFRVFPDGRREEVVALGDPDGNTYDRRHRLIDCASVLRAIIAVEPDGRYQVLADRYQGKRFNSPNDVVLGPDGALYFTDPTLDLPKGEKQEIPFQGVFRLDVNGAVKLLIQDMAQPNGLAFSPDGSKLYVDDSERLDIRVYDFSNGEVRNGRQFAKEDQPRGSGVPDGMRLDVEGNLYVTGPNGIWIWDPAGKLLGTVILPETAANLAWGDNDYRSLYITATTSVYRLRTKVKGFVPN